MAAYSEKSLKDKLGIPDGADLLVVNPPRPYTQIVKGISSSMISSEMNYLYLFIHAFFTESSELKKTFLKLKNSLEKGGQLWISWPKKTSKLKGDLSDNLVREIGLENDLVDVKVCSIDDDWSGIKFVFRLKDR